MTVIYKIKKEISKVHKNTLQHYNIKDIFDILNIMFINIYHQKRLTLRLTQSHVRISKVTLEFSYIFVFNLFFFA